MGMPSELTREHLEKVLGIKDIDINGEYVIGKNNTYYSIQAITAHHRYGNDVTYLYVAIYDPLYYKTKKYTNRIFPLHRLVYAWHKGIAHANMDIDHIDNNPYNNRLDNLQELTRKQNLAKRRDKHHNNQWEYLKSDDLESYKEEHGRRVQNGKKNKKGHNN